MGCSSSRNTPTPKKTAYADPSGIDMEFKQPPVTQPNYAESNTPVTYSNSDAAISTTTVIRSTPPNLTIQDMLPSYDICRNQFMNHNKCVTYNDIQKRIILSVEDFFGPGEFMALEFEDGKDGILEYDIKLYSKDGSEYYDMNYDSPYNTIVRRKVFNTPTYLSNTREIGPVFSEIKLDNIKGNSDASKLMMFSFPILQERVFTLDKILLEFGWKGMYSYADCRGTKSPYDSGRLYKNGRLHDRIVNGVKMENTLFFDDEEEEIYFDIGVIGMMLCVDFDTTETGDTEVDFKAVIISSKEIKENISEIGISTHKQGSLSVQFDPHKAYQWTIEGQTVNKWGKIYNSPKMVCNSQFSMVRQTQLDNVPPGTLFKNIFLHEYEVGECSGVSFYDILHSFQSVYV